VKNRLHPSLSRPDCPHGAHQMVGKNDAAGAPNAQIKARALHPWQRKRYSAPLGEPKSVCATAMQCLFPWSEANYPGIQRGTFQLFLGNAAIETIRSWRKGKRKMPAWARDILISELNKRASNIAAAIEALENEKPGR
jgi:hypothetical protein